MPWEMKDHGAHVVLANCNTAASRATSQQRQCFGHSSWNEIQGQSPKCHNTSLAVQFSIHLNSIVYSRSEADHTTWTKYGFESWPLTILTKTIQIHIFEATKTFSFKVRKMHQSHPKSLSCYDSGCTWNPQSTLRPLGPTIALWISRCWPN